MQIMDRPSSSAYRLGAALLAALALSLSACGSGSASSQAGGQGKQGAQAAQAQRGGGGQGGSGGAIPVMAVEVSEGPLTVRSDTSGTVNPVTQSNVVAQIAGTVAKVNHRAGDWVKAGEVVVQLDDTQLALSVKTARSNLENARINLATNEDTTAQAHPKLQLDVQAAQASLAAAQKNYDSAQALLKVGGATSSQVDSAQSQLQIAQSNLEAAKTSLDLNNKADTQSLAQLRIAVEQAQNQLDQAQLNLKYASVAAPFAGQLAVVNLLPGEYVGTNTTVFVLVSSAKEIDFNVPPSDAPHLTVGSKLSFTINGSSFPVTVRQLPSAPVNGLVPMVASPPASFPVSYGTVGTVSYSLTLARGILIPIASLQTMEDRNFVFAIANGKTTMQTVIIVAESGVFAAVSGIAPGAQVIVNPPPGLLNGSQVQVVQSQASAQGPSSSQGASAQRSEAADKASK
jgi:multidrug efflux pump subunit AcrA (membrane-fusion protein)